MNTMTKGQILRKLGAKKPVALFNVGGIIPFEYQVYSAKVIGYFQYDGLCLTTSILTISSEDAQHGAMAFWRFYKNSKELAIVINAKQLEWLGIGVLNEELKTFLLEKGFQAKEVTIPGELGGGGSETGYSKTIEVT